MIIKYLLLIIWILCSCNIIHKEKPTTTIPDITINEEILELKSEQTEITTEEIIIEANKEQEVLDIINTIRNEHRLSSLIWDNELYEVAKIRSQESSQKWSHTRPDGTHWSTLSPNVHGENLAKGYDTAQAAVDAWMASEGHKANILRKEFTRAAISFYESPNGWFWCISFGY